MRRVIFGGGAILTVAAFAAINVHVNSQSCNPFSNLTLADVEVLAGECTVSASGNNSGTCHKNVGANGDSCVSAKGGPVCNGVV